MAQAQAIAELGWRVAQDIVWEKHNGSSPMNDRFRRVHEFAVHLCRDSVPWERTYKVPQTTPDALKRTVRRKRRPPHWGDIGEAVFRSEDGGPRLMTSVIAVPSCHGYAEHPTQKPLGILAPLIRYSCPPGGVVLDPTMGVGSTLVAARDAGRRAIGIEINEAYCAAAVRRLSQRVLAV